MSYKGAEQVMIEEWVESTLKNHLAFDTISAGLSQRVFDGLAPRGAKYPFIVWQAQSPPRDIRGVGPHTIMVDAVYIVKAVAQAKSYMPLKDVAHQINEALVQTGVNVEGGYMLSIARERQHSQATIEEGTEFRHLGGVYQVQATAH